MTIIIASVQFNNDVVGPSNFVRSHASPIRSCLCVCTIKPSNLIDFTQIIVPFNIKLSVLKGLDW